MATNTIPVEVIGRLYDFHITDIGDYDWQYVFRTSDGVTPTSVSYWTGTNDIDGNPRGNSYPYVLPIHPGSHPLPGYDHTVSIKTGYHFKFDMKTKGNMFGRKDGIRMTPTFYFVNKDGTGRIPVDLYYHAYSENPVRYFVKIGSADDHEQRYVILNDKMRNVPSEELTDTANYVANNYGVSDFLYRAVHKSWVGNAYAWLTSPWLTRTIIGPKADLPSTVDAQRALASIQHWYGEYSLPAAPYVVAAGTNIAEYGRTHNGLDDHSPIFLKDGYIIVNFNLESIKNADYANPFLRYYRLPGESVPLDNQWQMEGFSNTTPDMYGHTFTLMDGDVAFYHGDLSSYDDFGARVTH